MTFRLLAFSRIAERFTIRSLMVLILLTFTLVECVSAVDLSVGGAELIYSKSKRSSKGGQYWPDGNFGVVPLGNGLYDFYAANGPKPVKTTGTLTDPGAKKQSVSITNLPKKTFNYVSGGPVFQDPSSGARLMVYHAEKHGTSAKDFYSVLGMAVSTDASGRVFRDLGTIIEPNMRTGQTEVGGGPFAVIDGQLHVYYRDWFPGVTTSELAVARAPLSEVVSNALSGRGTNFSKYYNGSWSQPGKGGLSSYLEPGNPNNGWTTVSYNDYLDELVMVSAQWSSTNSPDLYLATSPDGVNFSARQPIALDPGEQFYPSLVGTGANPQITDKEFYVYYTDSKKGAWDRWSDATLMRRLITLDPAATLPPINPLPGPIVPQPDGPVDWMQVSDFRSDFQSGAPAAGWKYAWNPTGKLGNSATFAPLVWSNSAQTYNTTGGANMAPGSKTHNDDYLHLTADGGHPGKPKYFPIVGYTIQGDDGAGEYRLVDSSIRKNDNVTSSKEDGLQVRVYVNNTAVGPAQSVTTDGLLSAFNRSLGQLNVGDTVWVMVDPLKNQYYDSFTAFDFSLQKLLPQQMMLALGAMAVPEPASAALLFFGLVSVAMRRPRRAR